MIKKNADNFVYEGYKKWLSDESITMSANFIAPLALYARVSGSEPDTVESKPDEIIKKISSYIEEFNRKDILEPKYRKLVFVVGNSGTGKSTLISYLAGDDLEAKTKNGKLIIDNNTPSDIEIGHGLESKTFFPQFKDVSGTVYCDMPGFGDTRGIVEEISKAIFMKKVADHVEQAKILVTIAYSDIDARATELRYLVKHLTDFIPNINGFDNGVDVVITKVTNDTKEDDDGNLSYKTDQEVIQEISKILNGFINESPNQSSFLTPVISKERIKLFRRAKKEGKLVDLKLGNLGKVFENERRNILTTVENTQYLSQTKVEFGYSVTADAQLDSIGIAKALKEKMASDIDAIFEGIKNHYSNQIKNTIDIYDLKDELDSQDWSKDQLDFSDPIRFLESVRQKVNQFGIGVSPSKFKEFLAKNEFLVFLQSLSGEIDGFSNYASLYSLFDFLSKEKVFNQALIDLIDINLTDENVISSLYALKDRSQRDNNSISEIVSNYNNFTEAQKSEINQLLNYMLKSPQSEENGDAVVVFGHIVKLSEVLMFKKDKKDLYVCSGKAMIMDGEILELHSKNVSILAPEKILEEVYYTSSVDRKLTQTIAQQYYELLVRVKNYANYGKKLPENEQLVDLENKDIAILNYIHSTILSRINQLKSNNSSDLVIDILGFIKIIESNINNLKEQKQIEQINFYKDTYKSQIQQKVEEANGFIDELQDAIEQYNSEIDGDFEQLIQETENLIADAEHNIEELNEKKEKLEKQLPLKMVFGGLQALTSVLAFTGSQGALAGSLMGSGANIAEGFCLTDDNGEKLLPRKITDSIAYQKQFVNRYNVYSTTLKKKGQERIEAINQGIKEILGENPNEPLSQPLQDLVKRREQLEIELNREIENGADFDLDSLIKKCDLQQDLTKALGDEKKAIEAKIKDDNQKNTALMWVDRSEKVVGLMNAGIDIYNTYKNHESAIDEIDEAIRKNQETIDNLNEFKDTINNYSQETIANMKDTVTNLENSLSNKSHIALDVSKWRIQAYLKDIKHELDKMTSGFQTQSDFIHVFEKMSDAIATLVDIYDRIQDYQEQAQLVDYIANVNSAGVTVDYPEINELKTIILQNTILERYATLISAVKQWAFPFADKFFSNFNFMLGIDSGQSIEINATKITEIIKILKEKLEIYNATVTEMDTKIVKTSFGLSNSVIPPFFVWQGNQYTDTINKLFKEGSKRYESEEVVLISSVQGSLYYAVKFNKIELRIRHKDFKKQQELDSCLDNFNVYLTHSTDSYYKFNNKFYKFGGNIDVSSNNKLQLLYGFKKDDNGSPFTKNEAYEKLDKGELMLSPYTVWKVKLTLANSNGKNYFNDLEKYSELVNLELVGTGSYVDESNMTDEYKNSLSVDSYYQADDMIPIIRDLE